MRRAHHWKWERNERSCHHYLPILSMWQNGRDHFWNIFVRKKLRIIKVLVLSLLHLFSKLRDRRCSRLVSFSVFWLPSIKCENGLLLRNPCFVNSETKQTCLSFCNIQTVETLRSFWAFLNKNKRFDVWLTAAKTQEIPFKCQLHRSRNFENMCNCWCIFGWL